jgi:hypothetical protein
MGMATPEPVTPPASDKGIRTQTAFDLERTIVGFLTNLFSTLRLDNPTLNLSQATSPQPMEPRVVQDPDQPPVSYDPALRQQTLALKVAPRVIRGRVPRTVTGEIDMDRLSDVPNIIVQATKARVETASTMVTLRILFTSYDENPDSQGYQDVLNMIEAAAIALTQFGQAAIDKAFPIVLPVEWELYDTERADYFPHFCGEMTTQWELPSARPWVELDVFSLAPGEGMDVRAESFTLAPFTGVPRT